jgi:hypothetical protein
MSLFTSTFAQYPLVGAAPSERKEIHAYKVAADQLDTSKCAEDHLRGTVYIHNNFAADLQNIELSKSCHFNIVFGNKRCNVELYLRWFRH